MTFGEEGKEGARLHDLKGKADLRSNQKPVLIDVDVEAILDVFAKHGHTEVRALAYSDVL
jgi:hypothetical protein